MTEHPRRWTTCPPLYDHHPLMRPVRTTSSLSTFCDRLFDRFGLAEMKPSGPSGNQSRTWSDEAFQATEFLFADYRDFVFPPHVHENFAIGVIEAGGQQFRPGRAPSLIMPARTMCAINPGVVHEGRPATAQGWRYRMFYPLPALVAGTLEEDAQSRSHGGEWRLKAHVIDDPELYHEFEALHLASQLSRDIVGTRDAHHGLSPPLFARHGDFSPESRPARLAPRTVAIVRDYLHAMVQSQVSISDLAKRPASPARRSSGPSRREQACRRIPTLSA